jgi:hypothetical protein
VPVQRFHAASTVASFASLIASLFVTSGLLAGCGGGLPVATAGDAARAGVELADLQQGRSLVAAKCSSCHRTPLPTEHHTGEWPHMLDEMAVRSHLDVAQHHLIEAYLVTMAAR